MSASRNTRRKVLAVLAGGAVLGVGAAITLASWNDSEFASGTFTAGSFNLQGSTTAADSGYSDHASAAGAAALSFELSDLVSNLSPGDSVAAPFWVRLAAGTTTGADLSAVGVTTTGTAQSNLSYNVYAIADDATCDTATTGTPFASGATLDAQTAGASVALLAGATVAEAGEAVQLCFVVEAGPGLVQGSTATATWEFEAVSTS